MQGDCFMIKFGSRRGISSIVGSMIFLILMTSGMSVYFLSIQSQTDLIDTQQKVADTQIRKIQEDYAISVTTDTSDNNRLAIQVKNQGPFPLEVANIWIINKTDAVNGYPAKRHLLNSTDSFIPIGYGKNILENKPLYMNPDEYDIKVISTVGTIRQTDIDVNGNDDLKVELFAIPPDVRVGENVTIAMRVTNVGDIDIENVVPFGAPIVNPPSAVLSSEIVSAPSIDLLKQTESGFFTWHYKVTGTVGNKVSFTNNASGTIMSTYTVESNNDSDKIILREDEGGSGDLIVLTQDLLARPEIFLTIPSSQGDSGSKALWGVNVVNPTNATMEVTKLTITAFAPGANNNDKIFAASCQELTESADNERSYISSYIHTYTHIHIHTHTHTNIHSSFHAFLSPAFRRYKRRMLPTRKQHPRRITVGIAIPSSLNHPSLHSTHTHSQSSSNTIAKQLQQHQLQQHQLQQQETKMASCVMTGTFGAIIRHNGK